MNSFNSQAGKLSASLPISFNSPHDANQLCSHQLTALNDGFEFPSLRQRFVYLTQQKDKSQKIQKLYVIIIVATVARVSPILSLPLILHDNARTA